MQEKSNMDFLLGLFFGIFIAAGGIVLYARYAAGKALIANKEAINKRIDELTNEVEHSGLTVVKDVKDG